MIAFRLYGIHDSRLNTQKNSQTAPSPSGATDDRNLGSETSERVGSMLAITPNGKRIHTEEKVTQDLAYFNKEHLRGHPW